MTKPFSLFRGKTGRETTTFKKLMQMDYSGPRDHKQGEVEKGNHKYQLWDFIHGLYLLANLPVATHL